MLHAGLVDRPGYGWHACRRWFARTTYSAVTGNDILLTSQTLGHASIAPTVRYLGLDGEAINHAFAGVAAHLPAVIGKTGSPSEKTASPEIGQKICVC
jgi:hypothetical protein